MKNIWVWIVVGLLAVGGVVGGLYLTSDSYSYDPGVYQTDSDGHDHGYYGVE